MSPRGKLLPTLVVIGATLGTVTLFVPMAISLGCGVLFATVITLFLVPSLYLIVEDFAPHDRDLEQLIDTA